MNPIRFTSKINDPYDYLSPFYPSTFYLQGVQFLSVIHYYQYSRISKEEVKLAILTEQDPHKALQISLRHSASTLSEVKFWQESKRMIMYEGCMAKFLQNPSLRDFLVSTSPHPLIYSFEGEDAGFSFLWGTDGSVGENALGGILENVRSSLFFAKIS